MRSILRSAAVVSIAIAWAPPAYAGPPFMTDDPTPTAPGHYEIYLFGNATTTSGGVSGEAGIDFNSGAARDLQITAVVPMNYERFNGGKIDTGIGNIEIAAKFRFLHQETAGWNVAVFPRLTLPAASRLGDDHASLLIPVWVGRDWENWSTFGGGGCAINRGGNSQDYCIAGWAITHRIAPRLQLGAEIFHAAPDTKDGSASTILGFGTVYDVNEQVSLLGYAGAGLENTAETGGLTLYASALFAF